MVQPINYGALQTAVNPLDSFTDAFKQGAGIRQVMDLREQQAQQAIAAQQQAQAQQAMQAELAAVAENPNASPDDYRRLMTKYPALSEQLKRPYDAMDTIQQRNQLASATKVAAAFNASKPEIAIKLLREQAEAMRNSGDEDGAKRTEDFARMAETDPAMARSSAFMKVLAIPGGDKIIEGLGKVGAEARAQELQGPAVAKATAEATTAGVKAKYAESDALLDLEKKGWDIKGIKADIDYKRESSRIAGINADIAKAANDIRRDELILKRDEAVKARDEKLRAKVAEAESARSSIDNFINTADRVLSVAVDKKGIPTSTLRAVLGPVDSRLPTMQTDVADLEALVQTIGSQAFLAEVRKAGSMAGLTEKEGDKIQAALSNFDLKQSPQQFIANIKEAQRLMLKSRRALAEKYGIPDTTPDTPNAPIDQATIDALVNKYK